VKFGVWLCLNAHPRKLKREKLQNPTSAKIATLENFPLYGIKREVQSQLQAAQIVSIPSTLCVMHTEGMHLR